MSHYLIAGLGNPGPEYQWTRHNAGFMVLDRISSDAGVPLTRKKFAGIWGEGEWRGSRIVLLKPETFMNRSGRSVAEAAKFYKIPPERIVVIHDELDLPFGKVRIKEGGGHGGHNGLRSIIECLGTNSFTRIRIGIGKPLRGDTSDYVLGPFSKDELPYLPDVLDGGRDGLSLLLEEGIRKAMSIYNAKDFLPAAARVAKTEK